MTDLSKIEWVPGDWSVVRSGLNVRLQHPTSGAVLIGQVDSHLAIWRNSVSDLRTMGFELFVEPRLLPLNVRAVGWYPASEDVDTIEIATVDEMTVKGWHHRGDVLTAEQLLERIGPRPRIIPLVDVREVLTRVSRIQGIDGDSKVNLRAALDELAAEFGTDLR